MAIALLSDNPSFFASFPACATDISILLCWKIFPFCLQENLRKLCDVVGYVELRLAAPLVSRGGGSAYST